MVISDFIRFSYIRSLIILCFALQISGCIGDENALSGDDGSVTSERNAAAGSNGSNGIGNNTITIVDDIAEADSTTVESTTADSTTADSTTADSTTADSTTADSTTADSTTADSTTADSTTADSTTADSTTADSTTADSTTADSTTADSTTVDSTTVVDSNEPSAVTVNWTAPAARTDDSPLLLSEITGYRVYYGQASGDYSNQLDINDSSAEGATLSVTPGLYYFVVTCLDTAGHESVYSEEVMISI